MVTGWMAVNWWWGIVVGGMVDRIRLDGGIGLKGGWDRVRGWVKKGGMVDGIGWDRVG